MQVKVSVKNARSSVAITTFITLRRDAQGSLQGDEKLLQLFSSAAVSKRSCGRRHNRASICHILL